MKKLIIKVIKFDINFETNSPAFNNIKIPNTMKPKIKIEPLLIRVNK